MTTQYNTPVQASHKIAYLYLNVTQEGENEFLCSFVYNNIHGESILKWQPTKSYVYFL